MRVITTKVSRAVINGALIKLMNSRSRSTRISLTMISLKRADAERVYTGANIGDDHVRETRSLNEFLPRTSNCVGQTLCAWRRSATLRLVLVPALIEQIYNEASRFVTMA